MSTVNRNKKLLTQLLLFVGSLFLTALVVTSAVTSAQADTIKACLIRTTDTSRWSPPSPDPAGIAYLPNGHLLISDSEVDEMSIFQGVNLYEADRSGTLRATSTTWTGTGAPPTFTREPTGVAVNPANGHLFFSDDDKKTIFEVDVGADGQYGTADDIRTSFSTMALNAFAPVDPEGITFGQGDLFVVDGLGNGIYRISTGANGRFNGVPPAGDDVTVNHFDTASLGVLDPEGVAFNPDNNTLYIIGTHRQLVEATTTGEFIRTIDISALPLVTPGDVAYAPGSTIPVINHLYIVDRGVDNDVNPLENDGKVYEITLNSIECMLPPF